MSLPPFRSTTFVCGPRSNSAALSTPAILSPTITASLADGCLGSSVVIRPFCRIRSAIGFMKVVSQTLMRDFLRNDLRFHRGLGSMVYHRVGVLHPNPIGTGLRLQ